MLTLLGVRATTLADVPPSNDDWAGVRLEEEAPDRVGALTTGLWTTRTGMRCEESSDATISRACSSTRRSVASP
jgi:hypothetical protein